MHVSISKGGGPSAPVSVDYDLTEADEASMLDALLDPSPSTRLSMAEALAHPAFAEINLGALASGAAEGAAALLVGRAPLDGPVELPVASWNETRRFWG